MQSYCTAFNRRMGSSPIAPRAVSANAIGA
jgi:hypothetical protein